MKMKKLSLEQMENIQGGGLTPEAKCGIALGLYVLSFIALAAATGGIGLILGLAGFGGAIWGSAEACEGVIHTGQPIEPLTPSGSGGGTAIP